VNHLRQRELVALTLETQRLICAAIKCTARFKRSRGDGFFFSSDDSFAQPACALQSTSTPAKYSAVQSATFRGRFLGKVSKRNRATRSVSHVFHPAQEPTPAAAPRENVVLLTRRQLHSTATDDDDDVSGIFCQLRTCFYRLAPRCKQRKHSPWPLPTEKRPGIYKNGSDVDLGSFAQIVICGQDRRKSKGY